MIGVSLGVWGVERQSSRRLGGGFRAHGRVLNRLRVELQEREFWCGVLEVLARHEDGATTKCQNVKVRHHNAEHTTGEADLEGGLTPAEVIAAWMDGGDADIGGCARGEDGRWAAKRGSGGPPEG